LIWINLLRSRVAVHLAQPCRRPSPLSWHSRARSHG